MSESPTEVPRVSTEGRPSPRSERIASVDLLRGLVIALMALDHVRDYFTISHFDPADLSKTYPALFLTRWVTHLCAPTFMLLAGVGAYLTGARGKSKPQLATFLFLRGILLIFLEQTIVKWGLIFNLNISFLFFHVLTAIGCSMIALAALIVFPTPLIGLVGAVIVAGHNALDPLLPDDFRELAPLWTVLHEGGVIDPPPGVFVLIGYPIGPWIGVMALGYALGSAFTLSRSKRRLLFLAIGAILTAGFVALRAANGYGDPRPRIDSPDNVATILSFLNCTKYPPSLSYLLMTLGPATLLLAAFDREPGTIGRLLMTFGRVPLFFFVLQWWVAHGLAVAVGLARGQSVAWMFQPFPFQYPKDFEYGYGLPGVYIAWIAVMILSYPPCKLVADRKRRGTNPIWSYL